MFNETELLFAHGTWGDRVRHTATTATQPHHSPQTSYRRSRAIVVVSLQIRRISLTYPSMSVRIIDNIPFIIDDRMESMVQVRMVWKIVFGIFHIIGMAIGYDFPLEHTVND